MAVVLEADVMLLTRQNRPGGGTIGTVGAVSAA
jgi:hypothetical protein